MMPSADLRERSRSMASQHSHLPSHSRHAPLSPPPARGAPPPSDHLALSDLLDTPDGVTSQGRAGDDLLSRMAGDSIDRMISGEFEPIVDPVDQLKDQLGNFFEELHHRQHVQSVSPKSVAPKAAMARPK